MNAENCFICRKHAGLEEAPPGGYIYADELWMLCHAPGRLGPLGTLFIESRRHFLDYGAMTLEEAARLGPLLQRAYAALRELTGAERIYQLSTEEGQPHLHMWLVPRRPADAERGLKFLGRDDSCTDAEAAARAAALRQKLEQNGRDP